MIMVLELVVHLDSMALWVCPDANRLTEDVHTQLENDIARFLGVEAAIIYAQAFSTISSVIPDFSKRGDIIVAYDFRLSERLL